MKENKFILVSFENVGNLLDFYLVFLILIINMFKVWRKFFLKVGFGVLDDKDFGGNGIF